MALGRRPIGYGSTHTPCLLFQAGEARTLPGAAARQVRAHRARLRAPAGQLAGGAATAGEGAKQGMSCFCPASFGRVRHGVLNLPSSSSGGNGTQHVGSASISGSEVGHRTGVCLDGVCESGIQPGRFAPGGAVCHPLHAAYVTADLILIGFSWTC